ncbi:hypothetical protein F4810DRAFT_354503 [Camillea tinctor]|nr:hypothetical protein F4810DRAFT_354503 [Camillea tinctor]
MEQTKALNALEPFLALTKSATAPRAAADLVTQATSHPNTYVFTELLQAPQIQALSEAPDYAVYLSLLEIFSHGTYTTYTSTPNLPDLNDVQALKLRQLSVLTLAKDPHNLTYAALQQSLNLPDSRAVEDLIISAVYAGLIEAQLDPRNQTVHISSVSPLRDLAPNSIPSMLASLRAWSGRCTDTLSDLEAQISAIRAAAAQRHADKRAWEALQARLVEEEQNAEHSAHGRGQSAIINRALRGSRFGGKRSSGSLEPGLDDDEAMDLDEDDQDDGEYGSNGGGASLGGPGKKRASRRKL